MFFYVDESGHTGTNLFDPNQPMIYYGVLSSPVNLDAVVEHELSILRKSLGVDRLHASELGNGGLAAIGRSVEQIQKKYRLRFDLYRVAKPDHAIICFFDQVFDQGMNPAVTWTGYWTPMRYVLLLKLAYLFDEDLARKAWEARIELNEEVAERALVAICEELGERVGHIPDARSRELLADSLAWAARHPREIHYNVKRRKDILQITPNVIGFQSVMHGIASRIRKHRRGATKIVVDRQSQFNKAQRTLSEYFASFREIPFRNGPGLPKIDFSGMPTIPITFTAGSDSAGLELVDVHLWIFKRFIEGKDLAQELHGIIRRQLHRGQMDEISINAIANRWSKWFEDLPEPSEEQMEKARELMAVDERRRLQAVDEGRRALPGMAPEVDV